VSSHHRRKNGFAQKTRREGPARDSAAGSRRAHASSLRSNWCSGRWAETSDHLKILIEKPYLLLAAKPVPKLFKVALPDFGPWTLDLGHLQSGLWTLDVGLWTSLGAMHMGRSGRGRYRQEVSPFANMAQGIASVGDWSDLLKTKRSPCQNFGNRLHYPIEIRSSDF
jgi:hypothetical protein